MIILKIRLDLAAFCFFILSAMFGITSGESITFNQNLLEVVDKYYIHNILTGESELVDGDDEKKLKVILGKKYISA